MVDMKKFTLPNPPPQSAVRTMAKLIKDCTHEVTREEVSREELGAAMRRLREDANISLRDMAGRLDISPAFLSECETGQKRLRTGHSVMFIHHCQNEK